MEVQCALSPLENLFTKKGFEFTVIQYNQYDQFAINSLASYSNKDIHDKVVFYYL